MDRSRATTRETYDEIAAHFSATRQYPWPEVETFLADAPGGSVGLDLGCGNGRHLPLLADCVDRAVGLDLSTRLLRIARERLAGETTAPTPDLAAGDAATLPLAGGCADVAVYVATLHHLPTPALRRASLDELARVLAPGGRGLVSAWSTEHDRFDRNEGFDAELDWELPDGETVPRYYHVYDPAEFEAGLAASDLEVVDARVSSGNCYATVASG